MIKGTYIYIKLCSYWSLRKVLCRVSASPPLMVAAETRLRVDAYYRFFTGYQLTYVYKMSPPAPVFM